KVAEDTLVSRRFTAYVVMFRQTVDGHRHAHARKADPLERNRNDATCDHQCVAALRAQFRQDAAEFAMTYERLASHQRNMQRLMLLDKLKHSVDKVIAAKIG